MTLSGLRPGGIRSGASCRADLAPLLDRARLLGPDAAPVVIAMTDQPDLRLPFDDGIEVSACWHDPQRRMFRLPRGARQVRLLSRAGVPAETVDPFVEDRRTAGDRRRQPGATEGPRRAGDPAGRSGAARLACRRGCAGPTGTPSSTCRAPTREVVLDIHLAATMLYHDEIKLAA